jgi:RNA polymerase sigma factor (sigma-70 family)
MEFIPDYGSLEIMNAITNERDDLILAAQTGDAAALSRLLIVCQADARRYAHRHCHASDVDDAVQESLLIISRKVKGLKAVVAFSSWLFTVTKRECRRLSRAMFRHEPLPDEAAEELLLHKPSDQLRIDLANALESLPSHYLEVVLLRDFEELTIAEIAQRLGEQAGAVKSRLHRARELVREYMLGSEPSC